MLITYPSPTLHDGAGISWTGTQITSLSGMRDGRAGGLTRLAWGGDGTTPASSEVIRASNTDEPVEGVRVAALLNLEGLPAGLNVDVALKSVDGAYDYMPQTVQTHRTKSGEVAVIAVWPAGLDPVEGVEFEIHNNGDVDEGDEFDCGELVYASAADFQLDPNWQLSTLDAAGDTVSKSGQLYLQPVPAARSYAVSTIPYTFGPAMLADESVQDLRRSLAEDPRCIFVLDPRTQEKTQATWIYGTAARIDALRFNSRSRMGAMRYVFDEMVGRAL